MTQLPRNRMNPRRAESDSPTDCPSTRDWPDTYDQSTTPGDEPVLPQVYPSWSRSDCVEAGKALAEAFLKNRDIAVAYLSIVKRAKDDHHDHTAEYREVIRRAYPDADYDEFNSNDFANVHHAAWLSLLQPFSCLIDLNPHGDWGNAPQCTITHGKEEPHRDDRSVSIENFHIVPNSNGMYAINTGDFPPPPLTR